MIEDELFTKWMDSQSQKAMQKVTDGQGLSPDEITILLLKAQTHHFAHLDQDLRSEMIALRQDMDKRFEQVDRRFEEMRVDMDKRFEEMRVDMEKRFGQVDKRFEVMHAEMEKRFEQVDRRLDQVDKRLEQMDKRFEQSQDEIRKIYQAINNQTWRMIGAIGLIVILGRLAGGLPGLAG